MLFNLFIYSTLILSFCLLGLIAYSAPISALLGSLIFGLGLIAERALS